MISINGVSKSYNDKKILDGLSFEIEKGKVTALLGENGAGKSSLLNLISGREHPDLGNVTYKNVNVTNLNFPFKHDLFYVYEKIDYQLPMSINQFVSNLSSSIPKWNEDLFRRMEEKRGIDLNLNFQDLSRGQRMQVVLMIGLASNPETLLLDEITSVLDPQGRKYFLDLLKDFVSQGNTVLITTNIIGELQFHIDNLIILKNQKILINEKTKNLTEKFIKVRIPVNADFSLDNDKEYVWIGKNSDESTSYIISREDYKKKQIPNTYLDKRSLTPEEVFVYYSNAEELSERNIENENAV